MAKGEWARTTELIQRAVEILEAEHPMTIRQLFYRLVSTGVIQNNRADYQRVSVVITKAREDGRCEFDYIVDRSRPEYAPLVFDDANGYANFVKRSYRKNYWDTQPNHVEVWVEKDAIIGSIEPVTNELGVTIRVCRGFVSTTWAHDIADTFTYIVKPISVFYCGDHDPSGHNIESDLYARIQSYDSGPFTLERLAIFAADIRKFNLPPLRVKEADPRAKKFMAEHGGDCVELDALPPDELRRRIREAVEGLINRELWDRAVNVEAVELASIRDTVALWPSMADAGSVKTFGAIRDGI